MSHTNGGKSSGRRQLDCRARGHTSPSRSGSVVEPIAGSPNSRWGVEPAWRKAGRARSSRGEGRMTYIGIDVSKATLDGADATGPAWQHANDAAGIAATVAQL